MNAREQYLFDLWGYAVLPAALAPETVATLSAAVDRTGLPDRLDDVPYVHAGSDDPTLTGDPGETHAPVPVASAPLLDWDPVLPGLAADGSPAEPWVRMVTGPDPRLVEAHAVLMRRAPGRRHHRLHSEPGAPRVTVMYALTPAPAGGGGFCCIPASHRATVPYPDLAEPDLDGVAVQPALAAGDAVVFREALTHGARPWTNAHDRKVLMFSYEAARP